MTVTIAQAYSVRMADLIHSGMEKPKLRPMSRMSSIDASQETKASKINPDSTTENPKPNYARACLATSRKKHIALQKKDFFVKKKEKCFFLER